MDPILADVLGPLLGIVSVGTFVLIGMYIRYKGKALQYQNRDPAELHQLKETVGELVEHTRQLGDELAELQERMDFHERLLTGGQNVARGDRPPAS